MGAEADPAQQRLGTFHVAVLVALAEPANDAVRRRHDDVERLLAARHALGSGRYELLVAVGANLTLGVLSAAVLTMQGLPAGGSAALGASVAWQSKIQTHELFTDEATYVVSHGVHDQEQVQSVQPQLQLQLW